MKRVLLLLPTTGYRNNDFLAAAEKLGVEIVAAGTFCSCSQMTASGPSAIVSRRAPFRPSPALRRRLANVSSEAVPVIRGHSVNSRSRPHSGHPGAREIVTPMTALKVVQT